MKVNRPTAALAGVMTLTVIFTGCAAPHSIGGAVPDGVPEPAKTVTAGEPTGDQFLIVRSADTELHLEHLGEEAFYEPAPDGTPSLAGDDLFVFVRPAGWTLQAEQRGEDTVGCGPAVIEPEVTELGDGWWKVSAAGPADTYDLWLSASSGPGLPLGGVQGAANGYISWETNTTTDVEAVAGIDVAIYPDSDSYISLMVFHLPAVPETVKATVTVTGASGDPVTVHPLAAEWACDQPGDLSLHSDVTPEQAEALGVGELHTVVELELDGKVYTADSKAGGLDGMDLTFTPALP